MNIRYQFICAEKIHLATDIRYGRQQYQYGVIFVPADIFHSKYTPNVIPSEHDKSLPDDSIVNQGVFHGKPEGRIALYNITKEVYDSYDVGHHYFVDFSFARQPY